jgi:hypothetical protein
MKLLKISLLLKKCIDMVHQGMGVVCLSNESGLVKKKYLVYCRKMKLKRGKESFIVCSKDSDRVSSRAGPPLQTSRSLLPVM